MSTTAHVEVSGSQMDVVLVEPSDGKSHCPAVILCHHREGVDEFTLDAAQRLAAAGFVVAVPNFYHRRPRQEYWQSARKSMQDSDVVLDINATSALLIGQKIVRADRIGIIGHCMGGRTAFLGAATTESIKAAVVLYGGHIFKTEGQGMPAPIELIKNIRCPLLGLYGGKDHVVGLEEIERLMAELASNGVKHEFHIYENVGHAFQDFFRPDLYRKEASDDAWMRVLVFLNRTLR